jgi:hypothetical protein
MKVTPVLKTSTILAASLLLGLATSPAALRNQYTFNNDNANDPIGGQNGSVVDAGGVTAIYSTIGGQRYLDLRGNTGQGSNGITEDAYVDLPNGILSAAANAGTSGQVSIATWVRVDTNRNWAEIWTFGTSDGGENTANGGGNSPYISLIPQTGDNQSLRLTSHNPGAELATSGPAATPLSINTDHYVVGVFNQAGGLPGTLTLYLDGNLVSTGPMVGGLNLNTFTNVNNWIGRSPWPDPVFDGMINELSIYDTALTQSEVTAAFAAGPVPEPTTGLLALAGTALALARRRRR